MSKERELLKLCAEAFALHNKCPNLTGDIKELLAQPKHKQEPVAWAMLNRQQVYERGWRAGYEARGGE